MNEIPAVDSRKPCCWRWLARLAVAGAVLIGTAEVTLRYLRYDEFPVYDTDTKIGYIPKPDEAGLFAGRYLWTLNERSMLNEPWVPNRDHGILVIGDSLVWGEVKMEPRDKLGACLQAAVGGRYRIWSVGAGSWANLNEIEYLSRNDEVVRQIHGLVWVANSGDFDSRSEWSSELTHPRQRPVFLLGYLVRKAMAPRLQGLLSRLSGDPNGPATNPEVSAESARGLRLWLEQAPRDLIRHSLFVWYPDAAEFRARDPGTSHLLAEVRSIVEAEGLRFLDLRGESRWRSEYYRDAIHPNAEGNRMLATILRDWLVENETVATSSH